MDAVAGQLSYARIANKERDEVAQVGNSTFKVHAGARLCFQGCMNKEKIHKNRTIKLHGGKPKMANKIERKQGKHFGTRRPSLVSTSFVDHNEGLGTTHLC